MRRLARGRVGRVRVRLWRQVRGYRIGAVAARAAPTWPTC